MQVLSNIDVFNFKKMEGRRRMKKAFYLGKPDDWKSDARLYRLADPPFNSGRRHRGYVVVSGADLHKTTELPLEYFNGYLQRYETYIFQTTRKGKVISWKELEGSFRGEIDHARALAGLGYTV